MPYILYIAFQIPGTLNACENSTYTYARVTIYCNVGHIYKAASNYADELRHSDLILFIIIWSDSGTKSLQLTEDLNTPTIS